MKLTCSQGDKLFLWGFPKLLCAHLHSIIDIIRHRLDWHISIMAPNRRRPTIRSALRSRLQPFHDHYRELDQRARHDDVESGW